MPAGKPRLLAQVKGRMRARHLSPRTERAYVGWIIRYIRYHGTRHPTELGEAEIIAFLTHLAAERSVSRSTQMQALSALLLLYREVLATPTGDLRRVLRSASPTRLSAVLSRGEVRAVLGALHGTTRLIALLLYGAGLRLLECLTLRVKDLDFARGEIRVRRGKGGKDRVTMLPDIARPALEKHLVRVRALHTRDLDDGAGRVALPTALDRKAPAWAADLAWQWVFPASRRYRDAASGQVRRHHVHETAVQRAMQRAVREAGIAKRATCHTLRHSFATHLLEDGTTFGRCRNCSDTRTSVRRWMPDSAYVAYMRGKGHYATYGDVKLFQKSDSSWRGSVDVAGLTILARCLPTGPVTGGSGSAGMQASSHHACPR